MRKWIMVVMGFMLIICVFPNISYSAMKNNASPIVVCLENQTASRAIVFTYPTRDIIIRNQDATRYVWVDFTSSVNGAGFAGVDTSRCTLLGPGEEIDLYDFFTSNMTIYGDNAQFGAAGGASPITIEAVF